MKIFGTAHNWNIKYQVLQSLRYSKFRILVIHWGWKSQFWFSVLYSDLHVYSRALYFISGLCVCVRWTANLLNHLNIWALGTCITSGNWILHCDWMKILLQKYDKREAGEMLGQSAMIRNPHLYAMNLVSNVHRIIWTPGFFQRLPKTCKTYSLKGIHLTQTVCKPLFCLFTWPYPAVRRDGCSQVSIPLRTQLSFSSSFAADSLSGQQPIPLSQDEHSGTWMVTPVVFEAVGGYFLHH